MIAEIAPSSPEADIYQSPGVASEVLDKWNQLFSSPSLIIDLNQSSAFYSKMTEGQFRAAISKDRSVASEWPESE